MSLLSNNVVERPTQNSLLCQNYPNYINIPGPESEIRNADEPSLITVLFSNEVIIGLAGLFTTWGLFTKRVETLSFSTGFLIGFGAMKISEKIADVINDPLQTRYSQGLIMKIWALGRSFQ